MKFRLIEEKKIKNMADVVNTLLNNFEKMTENEILDLSQEGIINTVESNSPLFISPSGKIIDVKKLTGLSNPMHLDFVYDLLYYLLTEIDKEIKMEDITDSAENIEAEELEYLTDKGWIRLNTGTSSIEKRFYCVLPYRDAIKPTERQYDILKEFIEYGQERNKEQLLIYYGDSAKWYNLQNEEAQDIISEIKRYYAGFNESKENKMKFKLVESQQETDSEGNPLSPEQIEFFKNSKVRDKQGRLLVCYHGTDAEFNEFKKEFIGTKSSASYTTGAYRGATGGFFFSNDSDFAHTFGSIIHKYYLNLTHPFILSDEGWGDACTQTDIRRGDIQRECNISHSDGAMIVSTDEELINGDYDRVIIAFHPNQIKSITNKNPTNSNNINENNLNEVYPNKGESKKDFIARFMSVTKDEYPDIKQRYAVANAYWSRKDKKK